MRYYLFHLGQGPVFVRIGLLANSREEAVALVKEELRRYERPEPPGLPEEMQGKIGRPEFGIEMRSGFPTPPGTRCAPGRRTSL